MSWLEDGGSFLSFVYHRHRELPAGAPPAERRLDSRSLLHHLGDDAGRDAVVLARELNPRLPMTPRDRPFLAVSPDGGWLLAVVSHGALGGRTTDEELTDCSMYVAPRGGLADPASCPWRRLASWTAAPRVYRCRVASGELRETGWAPPSPADPGDLEERRLEARARDGTPIPREWHEAGRGPAKETTITDLIDCAEHLLAQGYTRPGRLAGKGVSAGGIAAGGAMVRRPDLWAAMVLKVPLTNALRAETGENGPINVPEFGSVTTEEGLRGLLVMDVYLRVRDGVPYPAVLLTAGMNDPRVDVWQPAELAARLQAATTSGRPVLLRIESQGGHGFGSTAGQRDSLLADELAFLLDQLQPARHG